MSYNVSEDMQLEDFDTVIEILNDFTTKLELAKEEPEYIEYTSKEYKTALKEFCKEAKEAVVKLESLLSNE